MCSYARARAHVCVCVRARACLCVCARARARECVCVCACRRSRETMKTILIIFLLVVVCDVRFLLIFSLLFVMYSLLSLSFLGKGSFPSDSRVSYPYLYLFFYASVCFFVWFGLGLFCCCCCFFILINLRKAIFAFRFNGRFNIETDRQIDR